MKTITRAAVAKIVKSNSLVDEKLLRDSMEISALLGGLKGRQFKYRLEMPFSRRLKSLPDDVVAGDSSHAIRISR
jgi:hypothetical protein